MNTIFTQNTERPALRKQPALRVWLQLCMLVLAFCVGLSSHAQTVTYIHTDGLGSPVAKSDAAGNLIANSRTRYEPYGMEVAGTATPTIGFTGHVNDADTGLTYMLQRYYDPVAGRFLSTDPVLTDQNNATSFNRYTYANNNPYKYIDPDGRMAFLVPVVMFVVKEIAAEAASQATGGATDFLSVRRMGTKAIKAIAKDTLSETRKQALNQARKMNHVPKTAKMEQIKPNTPEGNAAGLDGRNVRAYKTENTKGEQVTIREDKAATYGDVGGKGDQKSHFNVEVNKVDTKQHHSWEKEK